MSQELKLPDVKWVCGINFMPANEADREKFRYIFFELDKPDEKYKDEVLKGFADRKIPVLYQRKSRGWHFWSDLRTIEENVEFTKTFDHLNFDGCANTTIRVTRKRDDEIFELPQYQGEEPKPNNLKALRWFLQQEYERRSKNYDLIARQSGLHKYYKSYGNHAIIFYPLCPMCLKTLPKEKKDVLEHYQIKHEMFLEARL